MEEIEPIKKMIIDKISNFIKQVIPNGEVEVYGSHATKLCLHWSDIDLVLKPVSPNKGENNSYQGGNSARGGGGDQMYSSRSANDGGMLNVNSMGYNVSNTRNWLNMLYHELIKSENRGWL